jgi:hypothetical protein
VSLRRSLFLVFLAVAFGLMRQIRHPHIARCIFCPNKADSKEHAWSDWVLQRVIRPTHRGIYGQVGETEFANPTQKAIRVKCTCISCNTGWMKNLEDAALPLIGSMMQGLTIPIDVPQQWIITAWITLKAMVFEQYRPSGAPFYSEHDRYLLRTHLTMPPHTFVWIGRFGGDANLFTEGHDMSGTHGADGFKGYTMTVAHQYFIVQILTVRPPPGDNTAPVVTPNYGPWNDNTIQIWPARRTVEWPPRFNAASSPESLEQFVTRWFVPSR